MNTKKLADQILEEAYLNDLSDKKTKEKLVKMLEEQATRHAMLMAGLEAQIEQKAVIRASELVDKARKDEREKVLSEVEGWLVDEEYQITDPDSIDYGKMLEHPWNEYRAELRTKLNQLKGTSE